MAMWLTRRRVRLKRRIDAYGSGEMLGRAFGGGGRSCLDDLHGRFRLAVPDANMARLHSANQKLDVEWSCILCS